MQWKTISTIYGNELKRVILGDPHRLQARHRNLVRKDGIMPSQEELLLAIAENVDENGLMSWIQRRRQVRSETGKEMGTEKGKGGSKGKRVGWGKEGWWVSAWFFLRASLQRCPRSSSSS